MSVEEKTHHAVTMLRQSGGQASPYADVADELSSEAMFAESLVFGLWGRDGAYQDLALVGALMAMIGALAIGFVDRERRRAG